MLAQILACVGAGAAIFLTYTLLVVVRTEPWYSPQYFIPILGAILWGYPKTYAALTSWSATCMCTCTAHMGSKVFRVPWRQVPPMGAGLAMHLCCWEAPIRVLPSLAMLALVRPQPVYVRLQA